MRSSASKKAAPNPPSPCSADSPLRSTPTSASLPDTISARSGSRPTRREHVPQCSCFRRVRNAARGAGRAGQGDSAALIGCAVAKGADGRSLSRYTRRPQPFLFPPGKLDGNASPARCIAGDRVKARMGVTEFVVVATPPADPVGAPTWVARAGSPLGQYACRLARCTGSDAQAVVYQPPL